MGRFLPFGHGHPQSADERLRPPCCPGAHFCTMPSACRVQIWHCSLCLEEKPRVPKLARFIESPPPPTQPAPSRVPSAASRTLSKGSRAGVSFQREIRHRRTCVGFSRQLLLSSLARSPESLYRVGKCHDPVPQGVLGTSGRPEPESHPSALVGRWQGKGKGSNFATVTLPLPLRTFLLQPDCISLQHWANTPWQPATARDTVIQFHPAQPLTDLRPGSLHAHLQCMYHDGTNHWLRGHVWQEWILNI